MTRSRFWPLPISYFLAFGLLMIANAGMALAKAGSLDIPFIFKGGVWPVAIIILWIVLEFSDKFTGSSSDQFT